jgi:hypothetical protein
VEKEPELDALFDPESFQITGTTGYLILKIINNYLKIKRKRRKQSQGFSKCPSVFRNQNNRRLPIYGI